MTLAKDILKKVFSRTFLKRAFLYYNQAKSNTFDKIFYPEEKIAGKDFVVNETKNPFLELGIDLSSFDELVLPKLQLWTDPQWSQDQYLLHYRQRGVIEPGGWALSFSNNLIYPSLGFSRAPYVRKPAFSKVFLKKRAEVRISKVISLRDTGEENYFHFYNDIVPKLFFLEDNGVDLTQFTIIVSERLASREYFQHFVNRLSFKKLTWYYQSDKFVAFDEAVFCKPYTHTKKYIERTANLMAGHAVQPSAGRVFLTRAPGTLRYIENIHELLPILERFDFRIIDTANFSIDDQISLFRQCRYLVAIHGAGISNVIFRGDSALSLLEILHPSPYLPFHYIMLCKLFNYSYDVIMGIPGNATGTGGFRVDPGEFEEKLIKILKAAP